jgi:DNA invertase Pin-like site-specific DNA recombinase
MDMTDPVGLTPGEIREALADWKYHAGRRDELVRAAYAAGIPVTEIHELTGLSRMTVYKILGVGEDT